MNMNTNTDTNLQTLPPSEAAGEFAARFEALRAELNHVFVGHDELLELLLSALIADGHVLLEGVPGLGKTLLVRSLAGCLSLQFSRIQFTPDLMPMDLIGGQQLFENGANSVILKFVPGPLHANFILADEINRATPKTQSALLEAMQEHQITAGRETFVLPQPFFVIATQNPIEQEGTYPLPEAELDRFMVKLLLQYPREEEYDRILDLTTTGKHVEVHPVCTGEELLQMRTVAQTVLLEESVKRCAVHLVMATQPESPYATAECRKYIRFGAGPRALQNLVRLAKVRALRQGRTIVGEEDLRWAFLPVVRHRILLGFEAQNDAMDADAVLKEILSKIRV